ncbi:MAG: putative lipopolysaccharide heptosyltransferase III [Pseudomonadota bacterium]
MLNDAINFHKIQGVLVTKLRHHGDVLLTSPVFSVLKKHYPHLKLDALVYHETGEMLTLHPAIDHVFTVDRAWKKRGFFKQVQNELALLKKLQAQNYDLLIHLTEHWRGLYLKRLLRVPFAVTQVYARRSGRYWRKTFTHHYPAPLNSRHVVEKNLDALRRLGLYPQTEDCGLVLFPGAGAEKRIDGLMQEYGLILKEFVQLHPTSRWFYKTWDAAKTSALIDRLEESGRRVVVTAAPAEQELELVKRVLSNTKSAPVNLSGLLSLKELAALIARARCLVGVDSVPMHIAAAMSTPVVALFGPSNDILWAPWQVRHQVVSSKQHPCRPCAQHGCGGGGWSDCLNDIAVDEVFAAVDHLTTGISQNINYRDYI